MKLTVIGYWGGYPAADGATSSYLLEKDNFSLLIDVGSGALSALQRHKTVSELDAVIVSHYHHDHIADVGVLQYARLVQNNVTGREKVLPIYGHIEDQHGFASLTHDYTKGIAYDPKQSLEVGPFTITFLKTKHPVPCYAMRITDGENVLVYTADSSYMPELISFAKDADLLVTDCNYYAGLDGSKAGHMTSEEAAGIASDANVKSLLLSHLPQFGDTNQLVEEARGIFKGEINLAAKGFTWN
ncbi:MBL fold metallo-hydrolase [Oceanobacillus sp. 143]|uniref:Metallo-beta-lactamase domain-containing protein n=1 Tax=Oceanobacillus zhaokaii TaxID=2052660 RepID=A0A345PFG0_9BACI|nr:MBL fold metallo-hydrolase [Oceanobacillus zhaokaii]AXI08740.1 hypothetical protein CUC15_07345 [Oceanobacillus zhaokaii]QGS68469.1 MBL fold metallo-hydrolase [Oceanobacillus sp. 143]